MQNYKKGHFYFTLSTLICAMQLGLQCRKNIISYFLGPEMFKKLKKQNKCKRWLVESGLSLTRSRSPWPRGRARRPARQALASQAASALFAPSGRPQACPRVPRVMMRSRKRLQRWKNTTVCVCVCVCRVCVVVVVVVIFR